MNPNIQRLIDIGTVLIEDPSTDLDYTLRCLSELATMAQYVQGVDRASECLASLRNGQDTKGNMIKEFLKKRGYDE